MEDTTYCPVHEAIQILQEKWTLHIIRSLLDGPKGFNELSRAVGGCNSATLTHRLEQLEARQLLSKTVISRMPPRSSYALSEAGVALGGVVAAIADWGTRYLHPDGRGSFLIGQ